jgi:hypothetical protein
LASIPAAAAVVCQGDRGHVRVVDLHAFLVRHDLVVPLRTVPLSGVLGWWRIWPCCRRGLPEHCSIPEDGDIAVVIRVIIPLLPKEDEAIIWVLLHR